MALNLFLFFLICVSFFYGVLEAKGPCFLRNSVCRSIAINPADVRILLDLKSSISFDDEYAGPFGSDWNASLSCVNGWSGICTDRFGRVTEISLTGLELTGRIPNSLGGLSSLIYLNLSLNYFDTLPSTLGLLSNLKYLDISMNVFSKTVLGSLSKIKALNYLDLCYNLISGPVPTLKNLSTLRYLDLSHNRLSGTIPASIGTYKSLVTLRLSNNLLCGSLPNFSSMPHLRTFSVASNFLSGRIPSSIQTKFCLPASPPFNDNCLIDSKRGCPVRSNPQYVCDIQCNPIPNLSGNHAYRAIAKLSSTFSYGVADNAVDGSSGNGSFSSHSCAQTLPGSNPYLRVDLEYQVAISSVVLYNRLDCCSNNLNGVQVYIGPSGSKYNAARNSPCKDPKFKFGPTSLGFPLKVQCSKKMSRFVWIVVPGNNRTLSVCEVAVFGS